jgi:lipid-A-disaccharide synthase
MTEEEETIAGMAEDKPFKQILIVAAENSAENYGAQIVEQFNRKNRDSSGSPIQLSHDVRFFGVGGDRMQKQGVELIFHNKELSVVGIIEVIAHLRKLKIIMNRLIEEAIRRKADAVLLIDYPDFNLRLAKKLKKAGIRVYYYISPTVWAWRYSRVETIKKYVDHLFIIFPFEKTIYSKEKISHTYVGHPLLPMIQVTQERSDFRAQRNIPDHRIVVTLLPGSRKSEVHFLLEEMLAAMEILDKTYELEVFLMKADSIDHEILSPYLEACPLNINVLPQEQGYNSINASDIVLGTCGTSNLEIAVLGVPFTAGYRVNKLSYALGKGFVKIDLYSIVNILAGKEVIKELIQKDYNRENIVAEMRRILDNPDVRKEMLARFDDIRRQLTQEAHPPEIIYNKIADDLKLR